MAENRLNKEAEAPAAEEAPVITNFDIVKEKLKPDAIDAEQLMNTVLASPKKRQAAGKVALNDGSRCAFCWKRREDPLNSETMCVHWAYPSNQCRANCLRWLKLEAGAKAPKEWRKEQA